MKNLVWNKYEEALLLYTFILIENGVFEKEKAVSWLSDILRKKAIEDEKAIDDTYRNVNGINMRLANIMYLTTNGKAGLKNVSELDREFTEFVYQKPEQFIALLLEAAKEYHISITIDERLVRTNIDDVLLSEYPVAYRRIYKCLQSDDCGLSIEEIYLKINRILYSEHIKSILTKASWCYLFMDKYYYSKLALLKDNKGNFNENSEIFDVKYNDLIGFHLLSEIEKEAVLLSEDKIVDWFWRTEDKSFVDLCKKNGLSYMHDLYKLNFDSWDVRKICTPKNDIINRCKLWLNNFTENKSVLETDKAILSRFLAE